LLAVSCIAWLGAFGATAARKLLLKAAATDAGELLNVRLGGKHGLRISVDTARVGRIRPENDDSREVFPLL
jgi:hypothetical protein